MIYLAISIFILCNSIPLLVEKNSQIFVPIKLYAYTQLLIMVPAYFIICSHPEYIYPGVYDLIVSDFDFSVTWTIICYSLMNMAIYIVYYISSSRYRNVPLRNITIGREERLSAIAFFLTLGAGLFIVKLRMSGGLAYIVENVSRRVELQSGLGPLNLLITTSFLIANIYATRRLCVKKDIISAVTLLVCFIAAAITSSIFGGRKDTLQMILTIVMVASISNRNFMKLNPFNIITLLILYASVIVYYFAILFYRNADSMSQVSASLPDVISSTFDSYSTLMVSLSYIDTYLFTTNYFNWNTFYYGSTFFDLTTAFLPSAIYDMKPAVDDGLYVRAATMGYRLEPGTPAVYIQHNSWPGESLGTGYMNGGVIGIIIAGCVVGWALGKGYGYIVRNPNSLLAIVLVTNLFLNFETSNLRVVNLISALMGTVALVIFYRAFRRIVPFF